MSETKRMISDVIMDDPHFIDLPAQSQSLYNYMLLYTDEYGVCVKYKQAMANAHANKNHLKKLLEARYLLELDDGIFLIKHFYMFNNFRKERMKPCRYEDLLKKVKLKENKSYTWQTHGRQMADKWQTNVRIREDKIREDNLREDKPRKEITKEKKDGLTVIDTADDLRAFLRGN